MFLDPRRHGRCAVRRAVRRRHRRPGLTRMTDEPLVLGIETSCDETGVGLVRGRTLLADAVASQRRGARAVRRRGARGRQPGAPRGDGADDRAGAAPTPASGSATSTRSRSPAGPGLTGALLVGVAAAKALALGLGTPLYGVNHLAAHVAVDQLEHGPLPEPCIALLVSGGHSSLLLVRRRHRRRRRRSARPSTTRPARRSTRSRGCSACRSRAVRTSTGRRATATRRTSTFPRGLTGAARPARAPLRLLVLRAEDRGRPLGRDARARRRAGAGRRRRRVVPGGRRRRAHPQGGAGLRASTASTTC